jgi:transcriptional regulator of acetoin/glycerol metabolism
LTGPADVDDRSIDPEQVKRHLSMTGGDVDETATRMGRSRSCVYRLIKRYGVNLGEFRSA